MAFCERSHLHRCEPLDERAVRTLLAGPLRLSLAIYRTDEDDGPDEPEA